jgi:hypothetical protein
VSTPATRRGTRALFHSARRKFRLAASCEFRAVQRLKNEKQCSRFRKKNKE